MPELPEVESVRRGLLRARLEAPVESIRRSRHALRIGKDWTRRAENIRRLEGATLDGRVTRRGRHGEPIEQHQREAGRQRDDDDRK